MDMQIRSKVEIWINDKYFFTADLAEIKYNQQNKEPFSSRDSSRTGTVISLTKNSITADERKKQDEATKERDFDVFFKDMVKRVRNKEFHIPVEWR